MAISPFNARPASPETERRLARLVVAIALVGIAATLLAYAISPSVRHAVGHAAHGVKGAVGHVFDHDHHHRHRHVATLGAKVPAMKSSSSTARAQAKAHHHARTSSTTGSKQPTGP
jgi:hypothetical protein